MEYELITTQHVISGPARVFYLEADSDRYRNKQVIHTGTKTKKKELADHSPQAAHVFCRMKDGTPCWIQPCNLQPLS